MDFDYPRLVASKHAVKRWMERSNKHFISTQQCEADLITTLENANILIENEYYRYLQSGHYIFPCGFLRDNKGTKLKCTTVLDARQTNTYHFDETLTRYLKKSLEQSS